MRIKGGDILRKIFVLFLIAVFLIAVFATPTLAFRERAMEVEGKISHTMNVSNGEVEQATRVSGHGSMVRLDTENTVAMEFTSSEGFGVLTVTEAVRTPYGIYAERMTPSSGTQGFIMRHVDLRDGLVIENESGLDWGRYDLYIALVMGEISIEEEMKVHGSVLMNDYIFMSDPILTN